MTDKERLAIAEEKLRIATAMLLGHKKRCIFVFDVDGVRVDCDGSEYFAYVKGKSAVKNTALAVHTDPVECAYLAIQAKLAAEREASRTPEERRLREVLNDVRLRILESHEVTNWQAVLRCVNEALEQGA